MIEISPRTLLGLVEQAQRVRSSVNESGYEKHTVRKFSFRKFKFIDEVYFKTPPYAYQNCGIDTRLNDLKLIAEASEEQSTKIHLTETTYVELNKLVMRDESFQPFIFGMRYY